jgi:hypothetical protein
MNRAYRAPRAALELVAFGFTAAEAKSAINTLPSLTSDFVREIYIGNLAYSRGHRFALGGARQWCERHGFSGGHKRPARVDVVGGVRL